MLALMQGFLQSTPKRWAWTNPSLALLKAMLINGLRSAEEQYDFNTQPLGPNEQGWGLAHPDQQPARVLEQRPGVDGVDRSIHQ